MALVVVPALIVMEGLPWAVGALILAYAWAQGGLAWHVYRRSRRRRGVPDGLLRPGSGR